MSKFHFLLSIHLKLFYCLAHSLNTQFYGASLQATYTAYHLKNKLPLIAQTVTDIPPFRTYRPYQTKFVKSYARCWSAEIPH